jgi:diguanylate cyclase (GGDEF)-like protein
VVPWALVGAVAIATICFSWIWPDYKARVVLSSALLGALHGRVALAALEGTERPRPASHWLTACTFALGAAVLLLRAAYELGQVPSGDGLFSDSLGQPALFLVAGLLPLLATFGFVLMCNDRFNQELLRLASFDTLTGAYNRRSTEEMARRAVDEAHERGAPLSAVLLDVDYFKRINDDLGHAAGDRALQSIVEALRRALPAGAMLGRMGGEEFMVVLPGSDAEAAARVAEQLRAAVEAAPLKLGERVVPITISLGVATLALGAADDLDALSARADHAMYAAKRGGRNQVVAASG